MIRLCAFGDEAAADIDGQIAALKRNRIAMVELRSVDGVNVADMSDGQGRGFVETFRQNGIRLWSVGSPIGKSDIDGNFAGVLESARRIFALAEAGNCENVRVFSFFRAYDRGGEVVRRLRALVAAAGTFGVTLCHENEKDIYGDTAERVAALLDGVPGLAAVFDPANYLQVGEDVAAALERLRPRTKYYHIKDVAADGALVPAGRGLGQIGALIDGIEGDAVLTLEPHLAVFDGYARIDRSEMKHARAYATAGEAFDVAADALKIQLAAAGYREISGGEEYVWKRD